MLYNAEGVGISSLFALAVPILRIIASRL